ncbi:MAG: UDP-N-acetylmuramoyl-L-alanine--D-glutamate ligase [Acidobacteria bacterium]|nr:UDP-N-acetylmuramoyl-L-alanine--D-glutamate ligase [Acidobacteriota bacterium]
MKVLVVGLGKSGLAACELLLSRGDTVVATDSKPTPESLAALDRLGVPFTPEFVSSDLTVISPGVAADLPQLAGRDVIGELELAFPYLQGPILGITGSNGKTTTTALCGHILQHAGVACQVGGNIGVAPAAMAATSKPGQWNVLELSSFQLETTRAFRPDIGVCLNVTPNHLDRHYTLENYAAAKGLMFAQQTAQDAKVLNFGDATCRGYEALGQAATYWFNQTARHYEAQLQGEHNQENIDAAVTACRIAGADEQAMLEAVKTFPGVEHRLEFVRELNGVRFYNDSKATSVDATLKAIAALNGPLWIILGGKDKGSDYRPLIAPLAGRARGVMLIGAAADKIESHLGDALPLHRSRTLDVAIREAFAAAQPGDTILLAPACASFDQFRSFEHRGDVFKQLVHQLEAGPWRNG